MRKLFSLLFFFPASVFAQYVALPLQQCLLQGATQADVSSVLSTNYQQGIVPSCTVTVYLTGTSTLATVYPTAAGGTPSNPITASSTGQFFAYVSASNQYDVVLSGGVTPNTYPSPATFYGLAAGGYPPCADIRAFGAVPMANTGGALTCTAYTSNPNAATAINNALGSASCVHVPAGYWWVSAPLTLPSYSSEAGITVEGEGEARSVICNGANTDAIQSNGAHLLYIRNLGIFDSFNTTALTSAIGSTITCAFSVALGNIPAGAVITVGTEQIVISSGTNGAYTCMRGYNSTTAATHISGATVTGTRTAGDALSLKSTGTSCDGNPCSIEGAVEHVQIGGHMNGVTLQSGIKFGIENTRVTYCGGNGFAITSGGAGGTTSTLVKNDYANGCSGDGFYISGASDVSFIADAADVSGGNAFELSDSIGSFHNISFISTDAELNTGDGYKVSGAGYSDSVFFTSANASGNTGDGVNLSGLNGVQMSGTWCGNGGYGLNVGSGVSDLWDIGIQWSAYECAVSTAGKWNDPNNSLAYRIYHPFCMNQGPSGSCPASTAYGDPNLTSFFVIGSTTANQSYGLLNEAGTSASDISFDVRNQSGGTRYLYVRGDGALFIPSIAPSSGGPNCLQISNTGGVVQTGTACAVPATTGYGTLVAGTVTIANAAACAPGVSCTYKINNCGTNSSTALGFLTVGTTTPGTSFVINSKSATNALVTGDNSHVCWAIN